MIRQTTRKITLFALLGATLGILESQLGSLLHSANIPFVGSIMISISLLFLIAGRYFTGFKASSLAISANASLIKFLLVGGIAIYPIVGIFIQAILFDLIVWNKSQKLLRYMLAGVLMLIYSIFHPFITHGLMGGWKILEVYGKIIQMGSTVLGVNENFGLLILLLLVMVQSMLGIFATIVFYTFVVKLEARGLLKKLKSDTI